MDRNKDILGLIRRLIYEETLFLRHWLGQVVDDADPSSRGRVKVTVPELGFMAESEAIWASPRQGYAVIPPKSGEWVEIYFLGGDSRRPVYLVGAGEVQGNTPAGYTAPKKPILWQDATTGDSVLYDEDGKELDVSITTMIKLLQYGQLKIGGGTESFTLGTTLSTYLGLLKTWMDTHTHSVPGITPGPSATPTLVPIVLSPTVPTIESATIKGE